MSDQDSLILELDAGNSSIKWRLAQTSPESLNTSRPAPMAGRLDGVNEFRDLLSDFAVGQYQLLGCRIASVAADHVNSSIRAIWHQVFSTPIKFAKVERRCGGVECGYQDLSQLGVDRWCAIVAAASTSSLPIAVIDAGTALTLDVVDGQGRHLGGYILPGLALMLDALREKTAIPDARIPEVTALHSQELGTSSALAIANAIASAVAGFVAQASQLGGAKTGVIITGGHAELVAKLSTLETEIKSDLVLDGLSYIVPL